MVKRVVGHVLVPTDMARLHIRVGSDLGFNPILRTEMGVGALNGVSDETIREWRDSQERYWVITLV